MRFYPSSLGLKQRQIRTNENGLKGGFVIFLGIYV